MRIWYQHPDRVFGTEVQHRISKSINHTDSHEHIWDSVLKSSCNIISEWVVDSEIVGAKENSAEFVTHDFVGEAREAITFVVWNVCVVVGKVKVTMDLICVLSSETKEGELVKVFAQVLCGFYRVTSLECYMEIVMGNVDVCSLPTAVVS